MFLSLVSCSKDMQDELLNIDNLNFYFLVNGKKYIPNDTLYLYDAPTGITHVEIRNKENEMIRGFIERDRDGAVSIDYDESYDTGEHYNLQIVNVGKGAAHFMMGKSEYFYMISDGAGNIYPEVKNGKEITLNVNVQPIEDLVIMENMNLTTEKDGSKVYIKLVANNTLSHLALGYYKDENNHEYYSDSRFVIKEFGIPTYSYDVTWSQWQEYDGGYVSNDYYAYYRALISTNGTIPEKCFVKFTYANKEYTVWKSSSSDLLSWEMKNLN